MGSTPKFCHQPFATKTGKSGDTAFSGVSGIFPPHAQCCPAHDKQPDMISCHPSGAVVPSLCPRVSGLSPHSLPLLLTLEGHPVRAHSHTNVAGKLVGDAANPPSVSSTPSFPGAMFSCQCGGSVTTSSFTRNLGIWFLLLLYLR